MKLADMVKSWKNKLLKDERKLKKSRFNAGKIVTIGFWLVVVGVIWFSFTAFNRTSFINEKINSLQTATATQIDSFNQAKFISSPAGEDYSERFSKLYLNIPAKGEERKARAEELKAFFAEGLTLNEVENLSKFQGKRVLKDIQLYRIKDVTEKTALYQYRVAYDVIKITEEVKTIPAENEDDEPKEKTVLKEHEPVTKEALLTIPLGTDGVSFNVIEQPYFEALPEGSRLTAVEMEDPKGEKNYELQKELKKFTAQFFTSYTENTVEEMSYLMEDPQSLKGLYQFQSLEGFAVYGSGENITIKTLAVLKDKATGVVIKQPATLKVVKQNGKYFVKNFKNTIGGM